MPREKDTRAATANHLIEEPISEVDIRRIELKPRPEGVREEDREVVREFKKLDDNPYEGLPFESTRNQPCHHI